MCNSVTVVGHDDAREEGSEGGCLGARREPVMYASVLGKLGEGSNGSEGVRKGDSCFVLFRGAGVRGVRRSI